MQSTFDAWISLICITNLWLHKCLVIVEKFSRSKFIQSWFCLLDCREHCPTESKEISLVSSAISARSDHRSMLHRWRCMPLRGWPAVSSRSHGGQRDFSYSTSASGRLHTLRTTRCQNQVQGHHWNIWTCCWKLVH